MHEVLDGNDFTLRLFDLSKQRPPLVTSAWWRIGRQLKPYISAKLELEGTTYRLLLYPRSEESFPAAALFERGLRREALLMAERLGGPEIDEGNADENT
jgi:hypothetical protein